MTNPLASELLLAEASELLLAAIRRRQCRVPTINHGMETALPCPLYPDGVTGIDIMTNNAGKPPNFAKQSAV
jgi:hypothetical protein